MSDGPYCRKGKPIRVLMTADTVGGIWTYAVELARALGRHGVEVALATMGAPLSTQQRQEVAAVPGLALYESHYRLEWMEDPWEDVYRAGDWLLELEEELAPDVIHLNSYVHGALPWRAPVMVVGHSCVLSWWQAVKGEPAPPSWDRYRREVQAGLQAADLVLAPTRSMLAALDEYYGPLETTGVVPNGIARSEENSSPQPKERMVLTAGRVWDEAKNVSALEAVAPRLHWPVYVAGEDHHPDGGRACPQNVNYLGYLPRKSLRQWYRRAAIYALPARYEPFGLSALEAATEGCALVLGDIPSLREVWQDAALYVPPNDNAALQRALSGLMANPSRRAMLAARAQARARYFSPERMATGYLVAYCRLITGEGLPTVKVLGRSVPQRA
ncbi:MAG: glycosyltransferase family 4 protein [Anaerolineae bacterium]|jgi:glycogen(starch) synthase